MANYTGRIINCRVNPRTGSTPQVGDIVYGRELGYANKKHTWCWSLCPICGRERWVRNVPKALARHCKVCCGRAVGKLAKQKGDKNPSWKGGRGKSSNGYVHIYVPEDSPFYPMVSQGRLHKDPIVLEHRLVMAQHLGRCLESWEVVHHINGIRDDNRIENLMLLPIPHHSSISELIRRFKSLQIQVEEQRDQIRLLTWHVRELERERQYGYVGEEQK